MSKRQDPTIDFGFHAVIPRIVRTHYIGKEVDIITSKGEKKKEKVTYIHLWTYVCLKDLCGESGTCFRTIRNLAKEVGTSTGMISETILVLHAVGLIHAEKKSRKPGSREIWHITIVDIWGANAKAHPTRRSHCEPTPKGDVHTVNQNHQNGSHCEPQCSHCEPQCSQCETEEREREEVSLSRRMNEAREPQSAYDPAIQSTSPSLTPSFISTTQQEQEPQETVKEEKSEEHHHHVEPDKKVFTLEDLTPEEKRLHDLVRSCGIVLGKQDQKYGKITAKAKEGYHDLAQDIPTEHAFLSLCAFSKAKLARLKKEDQTIYLGNLVSDRIAWKQTYKPPQQKNSPRPLTALEQQNQELMKKFSINYDQLYQPSARRDTHHG